ncbi:hypothetical protein ACE1TF_17120 [Geomicrobium sp. JSM 1781026]|uniref:hypothetical protein n=1 Tax=Geomicrobium sp. JSM 1781026 TaxID=3344580 RepID=UPI0035C26292
MKIAGISLMSAAVLTLILIQIWTENDGLSSWSLLLAVVFIAGFIISFLSISALKKWAEKN